MQECFKSAHLSHEKDGKSYDISRFGLKTAEKTMAFHKSFPEYAATPLAELKELAQLLGVQSIHVKNESKRFGLNAFKVLGGSYAIGSYIAQTLGMDIGELSCERMTSPAVKAKLGELTFVTATDGNHGRGVAWTANRLGQKCVVYMPKGTARERLENIRKLGADASIMDFGYDDCVRLARDNAAKNSWILVQDTAWDGYEEIPLHIMEGYLTMGLESIHQLNWNLPTHVFLQAGVGSMAGALAAFFANYCGKHQRPVIVIVEPNKADCFYRTAYANDGRLHAVTGPMDSIMAGLCCGEPCTVAWNILHDYADDFISMPDYVAAKGMRILGNPLNGDPRVISGESGASTTGLVAEILQNESLDWLRSQLHLDASSRILCISTEGDTDKANYRRIVWDGLHPSY
ncbi:MAG: diaminopropionate ammonia-lyase [Victivallales bacterium]|nr:diaminopropionate ammonia-lyase [Victivallales bacterium]